MGPSTSYPSLTFNPPLASTVTIDALPPRILGPRLCWHATLGREDYDRLCKNKGEVQVWSNYAGEQYWSATPFKDRTTLNLPNDGVEHVNFSLLESDAEVTDKNVTFEASVPLHSMVGRTVVFTYRVLYAGGSNPDWLGTMQTDGNIVIPSMEDEEDMNWTDERNGAFRWTGAVGEPVIIAELKSSNWTGWAFNKDSAGPLGIGRFVIVTSESVTSAVVTLALLPQTHTNACLTFSPVLYTIQDGTLSLEGGDVILHAGEKKPLLNAYTSTATWKDHVPHGAAALDLQTSDFLALSVKARANVGHLYLLPITGSRNTITMNVSDIAPLVPSSSVVLFDSNLRTIMFLPPSSETDRLRIVVGPEGGMIVIVPAYRVSTSTSVAILLHDLSSSADVEASPTILSKPSPSSGQEEFTLKANLSTEPIDSSPATAVQKRSDGTGLTLSRVFLLAVHVFRYFWDVVLSTVSPKSLIVRFARVRSPAQPHPHISPASGLVFKVTGQPPLLVKSEDISKLHILVGGKPLQTSPTEVSGGHWLIESTSELESDGTERRIEISMQE